MMNALPLEVVKTITVEDLMKIAAQHPDMHIEVVNGEITEKMGAGALHYIVIVLLQRILDSFVVTNDLGFVFPDGLLYLLNKTTVGIKGARVADVSFIRKENFPQNFEIEKPIPGAPDLAVEVMSPDDSTEETLARVRDYLNAGTEQVWILYPRQKELHQHLRDMPKAVRIYRETDVFEPETLFPGLEINIADVFAVPDWMQNK